MTVIVQSFPLIVGMRVTTCYKSSDTCLSVSSNDNLHIASGF